VLLSWALLSLPGFTALSQSKQGAKMTGNRNEKLFFDDFRYRSNAAMERHGWIIRSAKGWPGVPDATWGTKGGVLLARDIAGRANTILQLRSTTDGTGAGTFQSQICQQRKFLDGTYAARVRFHDSTIAGPGGDQVVQSFYAISPLKAPMDPDYSELDWEYLPNGGWGKKDPGVYQTSWHTFSPEPNWKQVNVSNFTQGSHDGWHILVTQVSNGQVQYFLDGVSLATHTGDYYPRSIMSINFNLWFIKGGAIDSPVVRTYGEDIDWVFFIAGKAITPAEVESRVASLRRRNLLFVDSVPSPVPFLKSPCDF
jgi:hypothetical protein